MTLVVLLTISSFDVISSLSVLLASGSSDKKRKASDEIPVLDDDEIDSISEEATQMTAMQLIELDDDELESSNVKSESIQLSSAQLRYISLPESTDEELMQWTQNPPTLEETLDVLAAIPSEVGNEIIELDEIPELDIIPNSIWEGGDSYHY